MRGFVWLTVLVLLCGLLSATASFAQSKAIVVFEEEIRSGQYTGDIDIGAQAIDADGKGLWEGGTQSADVSTSKYFERAPVAIPDGSGGAIVAFEMEAREGEYVGDCEIGVQRISSTGKQLWNGGERSLVVASSKWSEKRPVIISDGAGGAIVVYEAHALTGQFVGDVDVLAQRISPDGKLMWNDAERSSFVASGKYAERMVAAIPDGLGGAIIVFEMEAREGEYAGDCEIGAQRISADGKVLWGTAEQPIMVASSKWSEKRPTLVSDGAGGAIVIFEAYALSGEYAGDIDIRAQRISGDGKLLWNGGERSSAVSSGKNAERAPVAIPDGLGGAIVAFETEAREGEYVGDSEIAAQRISSDGNLLWNSGESSTLVASSKWSEKRPALISDGSGGAIIVFDAYALSGEFEGDVDVRAQRISGDGKLLWNAGEKSNAVASGKYAERRVSVIPDGSSGAIVAFEMEAREGEYVGDSEIGAQRISADGNLLWNGGDRSTTVASSKMTERAPVIIPTVSYR